MAKMTFELDDDLHTQLKIAVAQRKTTVKEVLSECAKKYVEATKKQHTSQASPSSSSA